MAAPIGNQNALKGKRCLEALRRAAADAGKGDIDKGLLQVAKRVFALALKGEQWAVQEVFNRFDGRVMQQVEVAGPNGDAITIRDAATSVGVARRIAYALAQGAIAKAALSSGEQKQEATHKEG